jgi:hypothetical protein
MSRRSQKGAFLGGPTILTVLMVLCFAVFALMALLRANSDLTMTRRTVSNTSDWYAADAQAEYLLQQALDRADQPVDTLAEDFGAVLLEGGIACTWDPETAVFRYDVPVDTYRTLQVSLSLVPDGDGTAVTVTAWQTVTEDPAETEPSYLPVAQ